MQVELIAADGSKMLPGNDIISTDGDAVPDAPRTREETRGQKWERLRREARASGMNRKDAIAYASREVDSPAPDPLPVADVPTLETPAVDGSGLAGLGDLPSNWPTLPPNAALAIEVGWVQANRLRVVQGGAVDLSRSLGPAPSYAALAWLETSTLYPAKWADVCVRATQDAQDDQQDVRRERVALVEVQGLLGEAIGAGS